MVQWQSNFEKSYPRRKCWQPILRLFKLPQVQVHTKHKSKGYRLTDSLLISPQRFTHRRTRVRFGDGIEVAVDIRRGAHIAMSEPFLDLLHWHAPGEKHRGAGVAKIVEADLLQIMLLQKLSEVSGDEVGIIELALAYRCVDAVLAHVDQP